MAEAIILPMASSILKKIASFTGDHLLENVVEEIKGLNSVKEELKAIAEDLESITCVLQDAEAKQYTNAAMKIWLSDLKSVVYDIDDLLDEVATDALQKSVNKGHFLSQLGYHLSLKPLISCTDLSRKIKDLHLELERIVVKRNKFGLTDRPVEALSVERDVFDACGYVNQSAILGRDEAKQIIIHRLLGLADVYSLSVLPILGMGGIGKTALAKLVYGDIARFDIKLWVCVSDKFDIQKIFQDILKDVTHENTSNYSLGKLVEKIRDVLNGKKYFLVLDDLWEYEVRLWVELKSILAVGRKGSVILITTRIESVASITQTVEPYNLNKLPDSICWCIFKSLAFADAEEGRYPRLCEIGLSIVEKCCGIPLVVQCLGSLLRNERDEVEWLRIKNMNNLFQLDGQYNTVKQLLKLSYDKLPSHLKPCFAHLSLFGKDRLYIPYFYSYSCSALGLLKLRDGSYSKYNFLNELISRSMLQEVEWSFSNTVITFKMHDILHDLAGDVLGKELVVVSRNKLSVPDSARYIAWELDDFLYKEFPAEIKARKARAFIFRFQMRSVSQSFLKGIMSNMLCLRILSFGGSQFKDLPQSISNLKHLRFLDMAYNGLIKSVPETVCELLNLEFLRLDGCEQLGELPSNIYKLINLRFFSLTTCQRTFVDTKFNRLPSLQHLWFDSCKGLESLWESQDVGSLTSLRTLEIMDCPKLASLPNSVKQLVELEELMISNCKELDLERGEGLSGLHSLRSLSIKGVPRLSRLPNGMRSAASSLKYLLIKDCGRLGELPNWLQSYASLERLVIVNCHNLLSLPQGIRHLNSLQYLYIRYCPHLSRRCESPDGEDLSEIRHVPEIWLDGCRLTPNQQIQIVYVLQTEASRDNPAYSAVSCILNFIEFNLCWLLNWLYNLTTGALMLENVTEEIKGLKSVKKDLKAIAEDLESITSVLHDAEAKQYTNAAMKIWLRDLKSVVYDIDDLLDEVATDALQRSVNKSHLLPQLRYYLSFKPLISRFDWSHKIKDLRLELERIVVKKNKFGLSDRPVEAPSVERDVLDMCGYVNDLAIVGRDGDKNNIINTIMSLGYECGVSVFPIYGMGGIGKTALAKLVYNDIDQFDIKLWVCVSDKFDLQKILQDILKDATHESTSNYSLGQLVGRLQDVLKNKKYFLVLDDLWEDNNRLWMELRSILVGGRGSVILITTRIEKVVSNTQTVEPYNLDKLSDSVCWKIFKRSVFADGEEKRYPNLKKIGLSIVKKCCGIPLVVQCVGSLLRSERDEAEWLRIKNMDNLNQLDGQYNTVKQLLKLSYDKLPSHLKPLFAHLSLDGKDYSYDPLVSSHYYSALGLLQLHDGSYFNQHSFNELLSRSMLQDVVRTFNNTICIFKIHDLLHDLAGDILGEELTVVTRNNLIVPDSSRYIAWGLNDLSDKEFPLKAKKVRVFLFQFAMRSVVSQHFLKGIVSNMPCLRILGLGNSQFNELPSSIGNLKHLRVLDLSNNAIIKSLPDTLCELLNLEYLCLEGCQQIVELPLEIYKLINLRFFTVTTRQSSLVGTKFNRLPSLRHMCFDSCMELVSLWDNYDIGRLTSLRTLEFMDCPKLTSLPNSMKLLVGLEELWIDNCEELDLNRGDCLSGLQGVRSFIISGVPRLAYLPNGLYSAASSLKYLTIADCKGLRELPSWLESFASLERLILNNCHSLFSLPKGIRQLNSLQYLEIDNCPHLSRSCAAPNGKDLSLIRHVPEICLDGEYVTPNQR